VLSFLAAGKVVSAFAVIRLSVFTGGLMESFRILEAAI